MEEHVNNMIENAYYQCNSPAIRIRPRKQRPPLYQFLHRLIYTELNESSVDSILILLRKIPWQDPNVLRWVKKTLFRADRVQVQNIKCLASIVAGLDKFHPVAVELADAVLEDIRQGLEKNSFADSQRRLAFARYLGELYNYMVVNAQTIFDTLYMVITLGHDIDRNGQMFSQIDLPTDTFRVRIVCIILDSCGSYFSTGSKKKRLDRFLLFLQRYLILKLGEVSSRWFI
jgi:regulator of nonsense transcripts 2